MAKPMNDAQMIAILTERLGTMIGELMTVENENRQLKRRLQQYENERREGD